MTQNRVENFRLNRLTALVPLVEYDWAVLWGSSNVFYAKKIFILFVMSIIKY